MSETINKRDVNSKNFLRKKYAANNLVLVGVTGCGKSAIGALLARYIGYGFLDLDRWIEQSHKRK